MPVSFKPSIIVKEFDLYLHSQGYFYEAIIVGGTSLSLMGLIERLTRDIDVLDSSIPFAIEIAANAFGDRFGLSNGWLNTGPSDIVAHLPSDWDKSLVVIYEGKGLRLKTLGRKYLVATKLWALCDRGRDLPDLKALAPNEEELTWSIEWVSKQDAHPDWPAHVRDQAQKIYE